MQIGWSGDYSRKGIFPWTANRWRVLDWPAMEHRDANPGIPPVNVKDVALIFEGGGMRASNTSAVAVRLLEENISFGHVYGVSAGASNAVNYLSRDVRRTEESFTGYVASREHIGWHRLLKGQHFFDGPWIYEGAAERYAGTGDSMEFDWDAFVANQAQVHIEAFDVERGCAVKWTKRDMEDCADMMLRVRASSALPGFMEPAQVEGRTYLDGGLADGWGISLMSAIEDGFDRFFIVRTQPRGYRKKKENPLIARILGRAFKDMPHALRQMERRPDGYNHLCDQIEELERVGAALVYYPSEMTVTNHTTDVEKLRVSYASGAEQAKREADGWKGWLGL